MRAAQVICPACGAQIPSDDMNLTTMAAVCRQCHALINLRELMPGGQPPPLARRSDLPPQPQVALPEGFAVNRTPVGLTLSYRWFSPATLFLLFFGVLWSGFLVLWYSAPFNQPDVGWLFRLFPLVHVAVGVLVIYSALAGFFNATTITVANRRLEVRHGPLPWPGPPALNTDDIVQIYVKQTQIYVEQPQVRRRVLYSVFAKTRQGRAVKLVAGLETDDRAAFIEQELKACLGLADQPTDGGAWR